MKKTILHSPSLDSILMVEKTIQKYSSKYGKYQLWKKLPKKMMYQTFQVIFNYLEKSGKIKLNTKKYITWTSYPSQRQKSISQKCSQCEEEIESDFP